MELSLLVKRWFHLQIFHAAAPIRRKHIRTGEGGYAGTHDVSYRPDARFRYCRVMATVALTVAAIRQSVRVTVKALDASITWIETRTDRALLRLRA